MVTYKCTPAKTVPGAKRLFLFCRQRGSPASKSKSIPMPRAPLPGPTPQMLQQAAFEVLQKCQDAMPCNNLGLTATEFQVCSQA